ncbi:hypothetical protein [Streptomyces sp. NPDC046942]|uniref:hypothetical protein n=1 Tax=Streptomyces sp. NPDC046942 TaxID=3155137 RepID=UPI0033D570D9
MRGGTVPGRGAGAARVDDGNLKFAPVVSERTRAKLNRIAARRTRPAKPKHRSLTRLREDWRASAREFLAAAPTSSTPPLNALALRRP